MKIQEKIQGWGQVAQGSIRRRTYHLFFIVISIKIKITWKLKWKISNMLQDQVSRSKVWDFLFGFCMFLGSSEQGKMQYQWKRKAKARPEASPFLQFLPVSKKQGLLWGCVWSNVGFWPPWGGSEEQAGDYRLKIIAGKNNWPKIGIDIESPAIFIYWIII